MERFVVGPRPINKNPMTVQAVISIFGGGAFGNRRRPSRDAGLSCNQLTDPRP